jgi:hypothetical protein
MFGPLLMLIPVGEAAVVVVYKNLASTLRRESPRSVNNSSVYFIVFIYFYF